MAIKKINMNIPVDLLQRVDEEAESQHMTRTAYFIQAVQKALISDAFLRSQPDIQRKFADLQESLSSVATLVDKDYAGILGQTKLDL